MRLSRAWSRRTVPTPARIPNSTISELVWDLSFESNYVTPSHPKPPEPPFPLHRTTQRARSSGVFFANVCGGSNHKSNLLNDKFKPIAQFGRNSEPDGPDTRA
jgi:hypothetical protein